VLIGLLFAARAPFLDQLFGDRAAHHHKTIGCWAIALIAAHVVCSVAGYTLTDGISVGEELLTIVLTYPYMRSVQIAQRSAPILRSEALSAQSAQINTVSGATYTSNAYKSSLQSAIDKAKARSAPLIELGPRR
jgi:hypothetical protein